MARQLINGITFNQENVTSRSDSLFWHYHYTKTNETYAVKKHGILPFNDEMQVVTSGLNMTIRTGIAVAYGRHCEIEIPVVLGVTSGEIGTLIIDIDLNAPELEQVAIATTTTSLIQHNLSADGLRYQIPIGTYNATSGIVIFTRTINRLDLVSFDQDLADNFLRLTGGTLTGSVYTQRIYTQGYAINSQGGQIVTEGGNVGLGGGNFNTNGGYISAFGNTVFSNSHTLTDENGTNGYKAIAYKDTSSFQFLKYVYTQRIYTQGNSISTQGGPIATEGGNINTGGGYLSTLGGLVYANAIMLTNTSGGSGYKAISYVDATAFELLKKVMTKEIDTQGNNINTQTGNVNTQSGSINTGGGDVNTGGGNFNVGTGQFVSNKLDYEQIIFNNASGTSGSKSIKLRHNSGPVAGLLQWDRAVNGSNAIYLNMTSLSDGINYVGLRMVENNRVYNYATGKYLTESATLLAAQLSGLQEQLTLQEQIEIQNNKIELLNLQMQAIIEGKDIPTTLPKTRRSSSDSNELIELKEKIAIAERELNEQEYQDEITLIEDHIASIEKELEEFNSRSVRPLVDLDAKEKRLMELKVQRQKIMTYYGKE